MTGGQVGAILDWLTVTGNVTDHEIEVGAVMTDAAMNVLAPPEECEAGPGLGLEIGK